MTRSFLLAAALLAFSTAGCNSPRTPQVATAAPPPAAPEAKLPEGSGCAAAIGRYKAVIENDLNMGHVNKSVYGQIQGEIGEASSACAAGQDARAVSLIRASKSRHGYPG